LALASSVDQVKDGAERSRAELDSHANMVVLGKACTIIRRTGLSVNVNAFASEVGSLKQVPLVDAAIVYDDKSTDEQYVLIMYNALYIPSMEHHLIPPFILREAGLKVNELPKIQSREPGPSTHTIFDPGTKLRIHLGLHGIFSYFNCRRLTMDEMKNWRLMPTIHATPQGNSWNPHNKAFAEEEAEFVDCDGNLMYRKPTGRPIHLIEEDDINGSRQASHLWATPMSVEQYSEQIEDSYAQVSTLMMHPDDEGDWLHRRALALRHDPMARAVASTCGTLVEEDLADALDELDISTAYGIAGGNVSRVGVEDYEFFRDEDFLDSLDNAIQDAANIFGTVASGKPGGISPERLSKIWKISPEDAQRTIEQTTQLGRYSNNTTISREFPTNDRGLRYRRLIDSVFFTDTFFVTGKAKSTRGFKCCQIFVSDKGFIWIQLMEKIDLSNLMNALKGFCKEVGIPHTLVCDPHATQTARDVRRYLYEVGTTLRVLERGTQWANLAERFIGILKNGVRSDLAETNAPMVLWDYCMERRVQIMNLTARSTHKLGGMNPYTSLLGEQADISSIVNFGWFEWCYYLEDRKSSVAQFPHQVAKLGRCLGPSKHAGNEMCQSILTEKGKIVPRRTIRRLTPHELSVTNEDEREKRRMFMQSIRQRLGDSIHLPTSGEHSDEALAPIPEETEEDLYNLWLNDPEDFTPFMDEGSIDFQALVSEVQATYFPQADIVDKDGKPISEHSLRDLMVGVEVFLPQGEGKALCKVLRRSVNKEGMVTGVYDSDPSLSTMIYDVQFPGGAVQQYGANIIAQNVLEQVEDDGHYTIKLKQILDHRRDGHAIPKHKQYITTRDGQQKLRKSTVGWNFHVEYTDGSKQWVELKDLKEINPVQIAEYVTTKKIDDEVAFRWWVPYTLRKKSRIIAAVRARARKKSHKYGIEVPTSVGDAFRIDRENNDTCWQDALSLEMNEIGVAIDIMEDSQQLPPGYRKSSGHIIFDVKMDFRRKARWVQDGHKTTLPETSNYAGVVSRESVRIAFTYAAMMGLPVMAGDIRNAYLQAPTSEKHYIVCGPEFGEENIGKRALITRSIYGSRVAGRDFWLHFRACMSELGFTSSKGDPDVWFRPATKKDGTEYNELCPVVC
jgi:hypothetical protein